MKILIAYDGSSCSDAAIEDLRRAGLPEDAEVLVVCVAEGAAPLQGIGLVQTDFDESSWKKLGEAEALAETAANKIMGYFPQWKVATEALWGGAAKTILEASRHWQPDLLVIGSHGNSALTRFLLGSVSMEVIHHAACSVRVVRTGTLAARGPIRIVVGDDGSDDGERIIRHVAARCWPEETQTRVISVVQTLVPDFATMAAGTYLSEPAFEVIHQADDRERSRLRDVAHRASHCLCAAGLAVTATVAEGDAMHEIVQEAERWNADVIFVGARQQGGLERFLLGSVSTGVVTHAHCAVEIVR